MEKEENETLSLHQQNVAAEGLVQLYERLGVGSWRKSTLWMSQRGCDISTGFFTLYMMHLTIQQSAYFSFLDTVSLYPTQWLLQGEAIFTCNILRSKIFSSAAGLRSWPKWNLLWIQSQVLPMTLLSFYRPYYRPSSKLTRSSGKIQALLCALWHKCRKLSVQNTMDSFNKIVEDITRPGGSEVEPGYLNPRVSLLLSLSKGILKSNWGERGLPIP